MLFRHCPKQTKILPKQTIFQFFFVTLSPNYREADDAMYKLREILTSVFGMAPEEVTSDEFFCSESILESAFLTNRMQETLAGYSYTLVRRGWIKLNYNGQVLTLHPGDLYIYSPGFQLTIVSGSDDYHAIVLVVDEQTTLEMPFVRHIFSTAYRPIAELGQPVVHLSETQADHFWCHMQQMLRYQHSSHRFLQESMRTLFTQFLLDLMDVMERNIGRHHFSERTTEHFVAFMRLLPRYYVEHHDLAFYADKLHITSIHLSRIVRQLTGRTVADYINQLLLMEASWLLRSTDLPLADIAERLHFSDQSSFGRFFTRMKGMNPKRYRMEK